MSDDINREEGENHSDINPSLAQLKASVKVTKTASNKKQRDYERKFAVTSLHAEREYAHVRGLSDHYWHRNMWSYALIMAMAFMILYQSVLLAMVGLNIWDFSKYKWLLPTLLVQI